VIQSAVTDIGPGTGTALTMIAHNVLGVPFDRIKVAYGDTSLPKAPMQGGSAIVSAVGSAVFDACTKIKNELFDLAVKANSPLAGAQIADLVLTEGVISAEKGIGKNVTVNKLMESSQLSKIEKDADSKGSPDLQKYSMYSFSVHFVKVKVNPLTGAVRITKAVSVADSGRIISPKTAASQMIGGVAGGIGMALTEEAVIDHRFGRFVNNNLADYHVAVHADVPAIETIFIDKPDPVINPMGAKGMGEIALIGFAGAVANAVFNATGQRIRELPITPDKVMQKLV
jgi:xanthine dehydrogenase YagR molybdenum-binding subunit